MKNTILYYSVGALLYTPATNKNIADSIINGKFGEKYSLALCLEDTINDNFVDEAEKILITSFHTLFKNRTQNTYIPKIFIRVRNPEQIKKLYFALGEAKELLTGFIIPKFSKCNSTEYINRIVEVNELARQTIYMMPIFESPTIIDLRTRWDILYYLKEKLDSVNEFVLNIRVGGNDLCHMFGFRRSDSESIHSIKPVSNIFSDIITIFGMDYVISGPVWEYYSGDNWKTGLINELKEDKLCGFVGKTAIHPKQIKVINNAYKVSQNDLTDALNILNWDTNNPSFVSGNSTQSRMDEYKTHSNWANEIIIRSKVFGITQQ